MFLRPAARSRRAAKCAQWDDKSSDPSGPGPGYRVSVEGHEGFQVKVALPDGQTLDSLDSWMYQIGCLGLGLSKAADRFQKSSGDFLHLLQVDFEIFR